MDKITKMITLNEYVIAKKEFEIASLYLSDTYNYVPLDLHYDIRIAQEVIDNLVKVMEDLITENSGQPEKK